ncbi:MAG: hypothetical protein CMC14_06650 [Flavobacteriaceae bacterium]|nr:hypothetical protein [Flavobacteriaceae bacterium]
MKDSISPKQILLALFSIKSNLEREFSGNSKYKSLVNFIVNTPEFNNSRRLTLKSIEIETGLKPQALSRQLKEIYYNLLESDSDFQFNFNITEVIFYARCRGAFSAFIIKNLKIVPRVGEHVSFPFIKPKMGVDHFYVENIKHHFESNKHYIEISLKNGFFNLFWRFRKHKAVEIGEIGVIEELQLEDHEIKERLGLKRRFKL